MQLRSKSVIFAIAAVLGAGVAVPGALALTGDSSSGDSKPAVTQDAGTTHQADAATQHRTTPDTTKADTDETKPDASPSTDATPNPKAFGVTGDEHRSDTAAEHSQADCHRATGPGEPADGSKCTTPPAAAATNHDATKADDDEATEVEKDDEATEVKDDNSGPSSDAGSGSANSGHADAHTGSDG